jgi:hypothetical protein
MRLKSYLRTRERHCGPSTNDPLDVLDSLLRGSYSFVEVRWPGLLRPLFERILLREPFLLKAQVGVICGKDSAQHRMSDVARREARIPLIADKSDGDAPLEVISMSRTVACSFLLSTFFPWRPSR